MDFILKEYDRLAPYAILTWIREAYDHGVNEKKLASACRHLADIFEKQQTNYKLPD